MSQIIVKPIDTPYFHAVPAPDGVRSQHAITTHLPGWDAVVRFVAKDPDLFAQFVDMYPRFVLHRNVKAVCTSCSLK
jgi:cystathionine gamma-synthase